MDGSGGDEIMTTAVAVHKHTAVLSSRKGSNDARGMASPIIESVGPDCVVVLALIRYFGLPALRRRRRESTAPEPRRGVRSSGATGNLNA